MNDSTDIDTLLNAAPSISVAEKLVSWADATRERILRGDMIFGALSLNDIAKIPSAYEKAAKCGDLSAWVTLAWWHAYPDFGEPRIDLSERALVSAISADLKSAKLDTAKIRWFFKRETATDAEKQQAYQFASETVADDPENDETIYLLALLTTHGFGVSESPETGFGLQERSADLGNTDAMFELFTHYVHGIGVPADDALAFKACERAADAGHPRAMYNLGAFNATGRGTTRNIAEAVRWYELAADAGNPSAMAGLGMIYATGDGVEVDRDYAAEMFDQAEYCGLDVSQLRSQAGL